MRLIGPGTQSAIESQVCLREIHVSVFDESSSPVEYPIPAEAIINPPIVSFNLENTSWEMTLQVAKTFPSTITAVLSNVTETSEIFIEGRCIQAVEYFAQGEPLPLFAGKIARVMPSKDWQGFDKDEWRIDCIGAIAAEAEAHVTRHEWKPTPFNPGASETNGRARLTGIVKRYRSTKPYEHYSNSALTNSDATATRITVTSGPMFAKGEIIYLRSGSSFCQTQIDTIEGNVLNLKSDQAIPASLFPSGTTVFKTAGLIPVINLPYFGNAILNDWISVYDSNMTQLDQGTQWNCYRDRRSGQFYIKFSIDPGPTFTVDALAVDRWVILNRRTYNGELVVPWYYILDGVQGQTGAETLNEQALTKIKADKPHTASEVWVVDPMGIYASDSYTSRWASVWIGGIEYRGKVATVDKTGGINHGRITFDASYPLRSAAGALAIPTGGEEIGNTSTCYYEILEPSARIQIYEADAFVADLLAWEPMGGWGLLFTRQGPSPGEINNVIPEYTYWLASDPGAWHLTMDNQSAVIAPSANAFNPSDNNPANDVSRALHGVLTSRMGLQVNTSDLEVSAFALAPFARAQVKAGELIEQIRSATIPPNWRLRELEDGTVVGGLITQKTIPDLVLAGGKTCQPNQKPTRATRVIVKGKQSEVNRAGQLLCFPDGLTNTTQLFDGPRGKYEAAARITAKFPVSGGVIFHIPATEPGRYPILTKASILFGPLVKLGVGGLTSLSGTPKWMSIGSQPNDGESIFTKREFTDFAEVAFDSQGRPNGEWYLIFDLTDFGGDSYVDEIEVYLTEGPYWEASLTSGTPEKALADGATPGCFGRTWMQPDRSLSMSYKYAPPQHLKRNQCGGSDRTLVINQEGITQAQARRIAEAYLDQAIRGFESYEWTGAYDPRVQPGDTVGILNSDGTIDNRLVWAISKEGQEMRLTLYDYSK